jgi:PhoU domain
MIFRDSIQAFADGDYELARALKLKDRELDALTDDVVEKLVERAAINRNPCRVTWTLSWLLALLSELGIMQQAEVVKLRQPARNLTSVSISKRRLHKVGSVLSSERWIR